ncbi:MAG: hypothetical protein NT047_00740 [Deltaproteobacteria bacterium]|nr:hypothetical protein [Deltaproteobacteria bacterium]
MAEPVGNGFHYVCGQCGSNSLYRDEDRRAGEVCIACRKCGNRYYGDAMSFAKSGAAPRKVIHQAPRVEQSEISKPAAAEGLGRGPGSEKQFIGRRDIAMEGKTQGQTPSAKKRLLPLPCGNCGRTLTIAGKERCGLCYQTGRKYVDGSPEQAEALRKLKERIEQEGTFRTGKNKTKLTPTAGITEEKQPEQAKASSAGPESGQTTHEGTSAGAGGEAGQQAVDENEKMAANLLDIYIEERLKAAIEILEKKMAAYVVDAGQLLIDSIRKKITEVTFANPHDPEDKIKCNLKEFHGYQRQLKDNGALYFLDPEERIIIDASRLGKMVLVGP